MVTDLKSGCKLFIDIDEILEFDSYLFYKNIRVY
jgi:hypothetical protein